MRDKMRNAKEDLEFFETNRFKGSKVKDIVEHWVRRAILAEDCMERRQDACWDWIGKCDEANSKLAALTEENDIQRASIHNLRAQVVGLREVLNDIYPDIAGHVILLKYAGEEKAANDWNIVATKILKAINSPDPGEKYRRVVDASLKLIEWHNFDYSEDCSCGLCGINKEFMQALSSLKEGDTP